MAFWVYTGGHDMQNRINLDSLGQLYLAFAAVWTLLLLFGVAFLISNRKLPFLRVRKLPLGILAVCTLHVYWCLCMLAYVLNGFFACSMEYWVMSTYLPIGVALYQASNTQLRHVAGLQQQIAWSRTLRLPDRKAIPLRGWGRLAAKWSSYSFTQRAITCVSYGIAIQILCTAVIFCLSRRFHASWGALGSEVDAAACRKGWEWWPSIAWQFSWTWLYAPYLLWKIRKVEDIHAWRLQTVLCSLAGLPGSPMWLIALYVPAFADINKYWVPPLWFSPGIIVMEASVIFVPCWQVLKSRKLRRETLEILAEWETKRNNGSSARSDSTQTACDSGKQKVTLSTSTGGSRRGEMYTMNALEKALQTNSTPLLLFAALKDFSGENISFLIHVRQWKADWSPLTDRFKVLKKPQAKQLDDGVLRRRQFNAAVQIYASFVGVHCSDFPINLSFAHRKELGGIFGAATSSFSTHLHDNPATPFDDLEQGAVNGGSPIANLNDSTEEILPRNGVKSSGGDKSVGLIYLGSHLPHDTTIPNQFGPNAFDDAEESIKYMVLTNTWPKFVTAGYASNLDQPGILRTLRDKLTLFADRYTHR